MTPVPRGIPRILGSLALTAALSAGVAPAFAEDPPTCLGEAVTLQVLPGVPMAGTPGRDVILGTDGPDEIYAGAGSDLICPGGGDDLVYGGYGHDTVLGDVGDDTVFGGPGRDLLEGGPGADDLWGDGDADEVWGDAESDAVHGGDGDDILYGGSGRDSLWGDAGVDRVFGEGGRDRLFGGEGIDELQGGPESDRLFGEAEGDFLWGDGGDDHLVGGAGDDLLQGGPGADALEGGPGFDEMWGGECGNLAGAVDCRLVPSGRPEGDPAVDPGDAFEGGRGFDACNEVKPGTPVVLPPGCDTHRGERGGPRFIKTSEDWWGQIDRAFKERARLLRDDGKQDIADALLAEVTHAKQVAACESLGDIFEMTRPPTTFAYGQTTFNGLFQHSSNHWANRAAQAGYPGASVYDPLANARVTAFMVAQDIEANWGNPDRLEDRLAWLDWECDWWIDIEWNLWD